MATGTRAGLVPRIRPEGISWRTAGSFLEVQIDLANESPEPTEDDELVIETAPLGAFVPFKPGARVAVAGFEPWERRRVTARIPIAALALGKAPHAVSMPVTGTWAGNLNVYFDRAPEDSVEAHRALDLKVRAGQRASLWFFLDTDAACTMDVRSSDPAWGAEVQDGEPYCGLLTVVAPTTVGARARVEVRVTRASDGKTVPVVFSMEAVANKAGTLGCVRI